MDEKDYIFYVGQSPGKDNVVNYHKKELKRDVFIEANSNAVFEVSTSGATATIPSTVNIEGESDPNAIPFAIALGG